MISKDQLRALEAAVDIAYDDTPSDDAERLEMENQARQGLMYLKPVVEAPKPEGRRWRILSGSTKGSGILMCVKAMIGVDPRHRIVLMPEVDYDRLSARILLLEKQNLDMRAAILKGDKHVMELEDEIEDLKHEHPTYVSAEPEVISLEPTTSFHDALVKHLDGASQEMKDDAVYERPLGMNPLHEAAYGKGINEDGSKGKFHAHLDTCERCRTQPMNLCGVGAILLKKEATSGAAVD